ncbi:MAG: LuxR C-terminal-related transcriptional regulator [Bacteroidota bacterium]
MTGILSAQQTPIWPSTFYKVLDSPYDDIIRVLWEWESSTDKERSLDSIKAYFDQELERPALVDRERVCLLAAYGQLLVKAENLSSAYAFCKEANDLAVRTLPPDDLIRAYAQAGYGCYLDFYHAPELAIVPLRQALVGLERIFPVNQPVGRQVFWLLVENQIQLGLLDEVQTDFEEYISALEKASDLRALVWAYNNYGLYLQRAGHHVAAIDILDRGLNIFTAPTKQRYLNAYVNVLETKSHSLVATGELDAAYENLWRAYSARKEMGRYEGAMQAMNYLIGYLYDEQKYQEAYEIYRQETEYIRSEDGVGERSYRLYQQLGQLFEVMERPEEASEFYTIYSRYVAAHVLPKAEARARTPQELSEQIYLRAQAFEQNAQIARLESEQLRKELRLRHFGMAVLALFTFVLILLSLGWRWKKRREEQERIRAEADRLRILELENENLKYSVESQGRDIKQLAADNRLRTQLKRDMLRQIQSISSLPLEKRRARLDKLVQELSRNVEEEAAISEIQERVEIINAAFEARLKARIPGITAQEIRFCSLLKLGMSNQQIAQILNKSDITVRSYKYRLNKKANLDSQDALKELVESL